MVVDICWQRAGGQCERCGQGLRFSDRGYAWSLHHRQPRGMGGSRAPYVNLPSNLLVLCGSGVTGCHGWVEANRRDALELGLLVSRAAGTEPVLVPVTLAGSAWWLDDYGGKERTDEHQPW